MGQQRDAVTDTDDDDDQFEAFLLSTRKDIEARSAKRNKTTLRCVRTYEHEPQVQIYCNIMHMCVLYIRMCKFT